MRSIKVTRVSGRTYASTVSGIHSHRLVSTWLYAVLALHASTAVAHELDGLHSHLTLQVLLQAPVVRFQHNNYPVGQSLESPFVAGDESQSPGVDNFYGRSRVADDLKYRLHSLPISGKEVEPAVNRHAVSKPENVGLQIIGSNYVVVKPEDEAVVFSQTLQAGMVPEFSENQIMPLYRVVWLAGVGLAILLGGMFLYRCKHNPRRGAELAAGHSDGELSLTSESSAINQHAIGNKVSSDGAPFEQAQPGTKSGIRAGEGNVPTQAGAADIVRDACVDEAGGEAVAADRVTLYPVYDQCQNEHIFEEDDWVYLSDDLGSAIEQAHIFCEFKQFRSAREVLEPLTGIDDVRLYEAIAKIEIQEIENRKLNRS